MDAKSSSGRARSVSNVALVCMPWQHYSLPSLGLSTLKAILDGDELPTSVWYFNMKWYRLLGADMYRRLSGTRYTSQLIFTPSAFPAVAGSASWLRSAWDVADAECQLSGSEFQHLATEAVPAFLDECTQTLTRLQARLVGFSLTYNQNLPAIALCRRLKMHDRCIKTLIGGFGAIESAGRELIRTIDSIDAVCEGEAEGVIVELASGLCRGTLPSRPLGFSYRNDRPGDVRWSLRPAVTTDLNALPVPQFDDFVSQRKSDEIGGDLWLSFEASRGCWWGQKSLCSFCGLNGTNVSYRTKAWTKVIEELRVQWRRHGVTKFSASDNILRWDGLREATAMLARLREEMGELTLFYQIKSSVDRKVAKELKSAGITIVQPGIESFDDRLLEMLRKGAKAITQIECLKFLAEQGIEVVYGLLYGVVGERAVYYRDQLELMGKINHLPPPSYVSAISYDRFSHYHLASSEYDIERLTVPREMDIVYPDARIDVNKISTTFDVQLGDLAHKRVLEEKLGVGEAVECVVNSVNEWRTNYRAGLLTFHFESGRVVVEDRRGGEDKRIILSREESTLSLLCDKSTRRGRVREAMPAVSESRFETILQSLLDKELVLVTGDRILSLPLRQRQKTVIGFIGWPCSGKTSLCRLCIEGGIHVVTVGDVLLGAFGRQVAALPAWEKIRAIGKGGSVMHCVVPCIQRELADTDIVVVDSIKAPGDISVLEKCLPMADVYPVRVHAPVETRRRRMALRGRADDGQGLEAREAELRRIGFDDAMAYALGTICNDGTVEDLKKSWERCLQQAVGLSLVGYSPAR